jgi:hypothetical protein
LVSLPVGYDHVFWDYFWDAYRDRELARTDNSVWEIGKMKDRLSIMMASLKSFANYSAFINYV